MEPTVSTICIDEAILHSSFEYMAILHTIGRGAGYREGMLCFGCLLWSLPKANFQESGFLQNTHLFDNGIP